MEVGAKEFKEEFLRYMKDVEFKITGLVETALSSGNLSVRSVKQVGESLNTYHQHLHADIKEFKSFMHKIGLDTYGELDAIALLKYFNNKYPAITLRSMYKVHGGAKIYSQAAEKLATGQFDSIYAFEKVGPNLKQYTLDKLKFTVPLNTEGRFEILEVCLMWLNERKAKSIEYLDVNTMTAVHRG